MLGPIDYIVLGFKGGNFDGSILKELSKASKNNIIRVIDLVFIMKDKGGNIIKGEFSEQPAEFKEAFGDLTVESDLPLLTEKDIDEVAKSLDNDTAAGVLVIEHLWAKDLKSAIINVGGFLIADGRIHPENADAALEELKVEV